MRGALVVLAVLLTGCAAAVEPSARDAQGQGPATAATAPIAESFEFDIVTGASVGTESPVGPGHSSVGFTTDAERFHVAAPLVNGSVLATWEARSPASQSLHLYVTSDDGLIAAIEGPSPLELPLPSGLEGSYFVGVHPAVASVRDEVHLVVSLLMEPPAPGDE